MNQRKFTTIAVVAMSNLAVSIASFSQQSETQDTSPHKIQFIEIEKDVSLEVADWGGEGPAVVLLAGLGGTVHSYDQFAPKLAKNFHVYGITRRGFGASSKPATGYSIRNLAQDIEKVIDTLQIKVPLVVGHSISGQELNVLGAEYSDKIAGLVYLDAANDYTNKDSDEYTQLLAELVPKSNKQKEEHLSYFELSPYQKIGYISRKQKPDYAAIKVPTLAIVAVPHDATSLFDDYKDSDKDTQAKMNRVFVLDLERVHRQEKEFTEGVKNSKAIEIIGARHDVYRSNEEEVLKAIIDFAKSNRLK